MLPLLPLPRPPLLCCEPQHARRPPWIPQTASSPTAMSVQSPPPWTSTGGLFPDCAGSKRTREPQHHTSPRTIAHVANCPALIALAVTPGTCTGVRIAEHVPATQVPLVWPF